jgi:hypothetical protein
LGHEPISSARGYNNKDEITVTDTVPGGTTGTIVATAYYRNYPDTLHPKD